MKISTKQTMLAHKAIALHRGLSAADKSVAACLIEHFNRDSHRCDPSICRIAGLTGYDQSTVKKSIRKLCSKEIGLLEKTTHGGKFYTNSYTINWDRLDSLNQTYDERAKTAGSFDQGYKNPPLGVERGALGGGENEPQTCVSNLRKQPKGLRKKESAPGKLPQSNSTKEDLDQTKRIKDQQTHSFNLKKLKRNPSRQQAAEESAKKRINRDMLQLGTAVYSAYVETVTPQQTSSAIEREMNVCGYGRRYLMQVLNLPGWGWV